jgi:spermidine/putrescine transport system ATP-binding protein
MKETVSGQELLRLEGIKKSFAHTQVLREINLSVDAGEFVTLLGPSGCGKTTTLRIIAGLEKADAGRVFLAGEDMSDLAPNKRNVHMVFQNFALFPHMNVASNIGYSLKLKGLSRGEIKRKVAEALEMVRLSGFERRLPASLSGGERQRVAVARALINRPKVLLLDEPLGALDLQLRRQMQQELKRLQKQLGITFIHITHDQEEALSMSDRIAVMREGRLEQIGSVAEVYNSPRTSYVAHFVGNANILHGTVEAPEAAGSAGTLVFRHPAGHVRIQNLGAPMAPGQQLTVAIRTEHITLEIPAQTALYDREGLDATVTGKSFAGGQLRISAALRGGEEIVASRHGVDTPLDIGDRVRVSWANVTQAVIVDREEPV